MLSVNEDNSIKKIDIVITRSKHKYEYQELAESLEPIYGKGIWTVFSRPKFTEYEVRRAHKIAQERGITKLAYLIGIIKKNIM